MEKEQAIELMQSKRFIELKKDLQEMNPADLAVLVAEMNEQDEFSEKELTLLFRILPKELAAEAFSYMDSDMQEILINAFSDKELREVIDELFLDDTVDIIEEMPANVVSKILKNTDTETRKQINELLNYPKDSAGSIMTTEFVYLRRDATVAEAFARIRKIGLVKETVYTCYVTENRTLVGMVTVLDMLVAGEDTIIEDIMETNVISAETHDDKEDVAKLFSKYDIAAIPVVDTENRVVGIVTFDDAMDVIQEENTEDISKMAAMQPIEDSYFKTSIFKHAKNRIVWVLVLMISSAVTGQITVGFEDQISAIPLLVAFLPMLMNTSGNCGSQSSTLIIRGIALEEIRLRDFFKVIYKEFRISILCSTILSVINFVRVLIQYKDLAIAAVVSLSLILTVIIATVIGSILPMFAKKFKLDPAIMSAPIITTVVDACSILIYFNIAMRMLDFAK